MQTRCFRALGGLTLLIALVFAGLFLTDATALAKVPHLTLSITGVKAADHQLSYVAVKTLAKAALTISVLYLCSNHVATSKSLKGTSFADRHGLFTWGWTPDSKCHGKAQATVWAKEYGQTVRVQRTFSE